MTKRVKIDKEKIKTLVSEKKAADLVIRDVAREKFSFGVEKPVTPQNDSLIELEIALRQYKRVGVFHT